jgi:dTDP-4-dehydrorhamnose reductase
LEQVKAYFDKEKPNCVIHLAGYTDIDRAEIERDNLNGNCFKSNVIATQIISKCCLDCHAHLILASTDLVFPGTLENPGPYSTTDPVADKQEDLSWYAMTKILAEQSAQNSKCKLSIVRFSNPFLLDDLITLRDEDIISKTYCDQIITVTDVLSALTAVVEIMENRMSGIFHLNQPERYTPYDLAMDISGGKARKASIPLIPAMPRFGGLINSQDKLKTCLIPS